jgi:hypothetical protein
MNGYLVLARCLMDDLPMRLFSDEKTAFNYAWSLSKEDVFTFADETMKTPVSEVLHVSVIKYEDGKPVYVRTAFEFA